MKKNHIRWSKIDSEIADSPDEIGKSLKIAENDRLDFFYDSRKKSASPKTFDEQAGNKQIDVSFDRLEEAIAEFKGAEKLEFTGYQLKPAAVYEHSGPKRKESYQIFVSKDETHAVEFRLRITGHRSPEKVLWTKKWSV